MPGKLPDDRWPVRPPWWRVERILGGAIWEHIECCVNVEHRRRALFDFTSFVDDAVMKVNVRISQALSVGGATYLELTVTVHGASAFANSVAVGGLVNVWNSLSVFSITALGSSLSVTTLNIEKSCRIGFWCLV
jgi:hypothetical protein